MFAGAFAVTCAHLWIFLVQIQRGGKLTAGEDAVRLLGKGVEALHGFAVVHIAAELVEAAQQFAAVIELIERNAVQLQVILAVIHRLEGRVGAAKEAWLTVVIRPMLHARRERHKRRHAGRGAALGFAECRTHLRPMPGGLPFIEPAGEALERLMPILGADDGANGDQLVHVASQAR